MILQFQVLTPLLESRWRPAALQTAGPAPLWHRLEGQLLEVDPQLLKSGVFDRVAPFAPFLRVIDRGIFADLDDKPLHPLFIGSIGLQATNAADQERRAVRFMVGKINVPGITDADQKFPAAGLFFCNDP